LEFSLPGLQACSRKELASRHDSKNVFEPLTGLSRSNMEYPVDFR
jgi:hypothetical protein